MGENLKIGSSMIGCLDVFALDGVICCIRVAYFKDWVCREGTCFVYILFGKFERALESAARFGITLINNLHEGSIIVRIVTSAYDTNSSKVSAPMTA